MLALTSGRLAAETIAELKRHGRPMTARHLSLYRDKLEQSRELREIRNAGTLTGSHAAGIPARHPQRLAQAARGLMRELMQTGGGGQPGLPSMRGRRSIGP
jgi:electron transfer flavoprotein-quinone oxidoreductase